MSDNEKAPVSDQSDKSDGSDKAEPPPAGEPAAGTEREAVERLAAERDRLNDQFLRAKAELANYQKRAGRERELSALHFKRDFIRAMLPALDALDLALKHAQADPAHLLEGVRSVRDALHQALNQEGFERIPAEAGAGYDPDLHRVAGVVERPELPDGTIVEELRPGYRVGSLVARHGEVLVSRRPAEKAKGDKAKPQQPPGAGKQPGGREQP